MVVTDALKACPLFKGFTDTGLRILGGVAKARAFPKGARLFAENAAGDSMLIVEEGTVRLSAQNGAGEDVALGDVGAGEPLGELTLVKPGPRLCTATAVSDVRALEIRHEDFQRLMTEKPQACIKLLMGMVTHFGQKVRDNREPLRSLVGRT
ncbi:cyclic nucleotide-binding domain-containing protein [Aggregicoccus sp. 17bor-14]|uniref:cyclic nucleotide-binding domain-containing protein n=1 Tax=Myxococcaceae TaxID=31 RepID=UPI00129D209D|nr:MULTISPECIES: cyclic nucleotide-binding domain-containing protein [Myxococcaceae]MBF5040888.1 cyclic nucleotide-binding domain-containing protein [Simulacricoccus sp. 17bor-14]MRI86677.1 cyclic nucleotide-binding domain-containing protein [Aggregicoccus sp. 17bor-14]